MTEFKTLSKTEIDELIERVERAIAEDLALSKADRQLLLGVLLMVTERPDLIVSERCHDTQMA
ncbi:hypothetical protein D5085_02230 [Ectothiorhodospiraceae bacterium BW-2]|nr:hypothetical protein D5085_02230 [Ectothiorhodospiraceae bacterium BW-2]